MKQASPTRIALYELAARSSCPLEIPWGENITILIITKQKAESQGPRPLHRKNKKGLVFFFPKLYIDKLKAWANSYGPSIPLTMPWHQTRAARHEYPWGRWCQSQSWSWGRMDPEQVVWMQHRAGFECLVDQQEGLRFIFYAKALVCMESCPRWHGDKCELLPKTISCTFPTPHWPSAGVKRATVLSLNHFFL